MNYLKMIGLATVAAIAMLTVTASSASATTLEIGGFAQNKAITMEGVGTSFMVLSNTEGSVANSCLLSSFRGTTSVFSGTRVTASLSQLSFSGCNHPLVTTDAKGGLYIEWEGTNTSGSVFSEGAELTVPTSFGFSVTCKTGEGTKIGTLVGVGSSSAHASLSVTAVLSCGFLLPSASLFGSFRISTSTGLGVVA